MVQLINCLQYYEFVYLSLKSLLEHTIMSYILGYKGTYVDLCHTINLVCEGRGSVF